MLRVPQPTFVAPPSGPHPLDPLERRARLDAAMPHHVQSVRVPAHVFDAKHDRVDRSRSDGPDITVTDTTGGYRFTNFDGPTPGTVTGTGTNMNGIANSGTAVGVTIGFYSDANRVFHGFVATAH